MHRAPSRAGLATPVGEGTACRGSPSLSGCAGAEPGLLWERRFGNSSLLGCRLVWCTQNYGEVPRLASPSRCFSGVSAGRPGATASPAARLRGGEGARRLRSGHRCWRGGGGTTQHPLPRAPPAPCGAARRSAVSLRSERPRSPRRLQKGENPGKILRLLRRCSPGARAFACSLPAGSCRARRHARSCPGDALNMGSRPPPQNTPLAVFALLSLRSDTFNAVARGRRSRARCR